VIPREHVSGIDALGEGHYELAARALTAVPKVARAAGGLEAGYRVIVNQGAAAGQTVPHLHLHVLGGRQFSEGMVPERG
jgi:histidine triad (HIT) family protein